MALTGAAAARVTDLHVCPIAGTPPHVGGPILPGGCKTVFIGGQLAARVGDFAACVGSIDAVARGCSGVSIGGAAAARVGDSTKHGGAIVAGDVSVLMGVPWQAELLIAAAAVGATFCLICQDAEGLPLLNPTELAAAQEAGAATTPKPAAVSGASAGGESSAAQPSAAGYAMRQAADRGDAYCIIKND